MLCVMLVDSMMAFREELARNLAAYLPEGSRIEQASTSLNIRDRLAKVKPDVVIMDVSVPERAEPRDWMIHLLAAFSMPVTICSSRAALRGPALAAGAEAFVMKPPPALLGQPFFRKMARDVEAAAAKKNKSNPVDVRQNNPMYIPPKGGTAASARAEQSSEAARMGAALRGLRYGKEAVEEARPDKLPGHSVNVVGRKGADSKDVANDMKRLIGDMKRFAERLDKAADGSGGFMPRYASVVPPIKVDEYEGEVEMIAIGASTGGTEALSKVLSALKPPLPGIVVVQHIPSSFSRMFAERLERECDVKVKEAESGDRVERNHVYIAPGGKHMRVNKVGEEFLLDCQPGPKVHGVCPSVDILFASVADAVGPAALGVILTGMGRDGADGMLRMRQQGSRTLGQDEASCIVYGMPRAAWECGAVARQVPLQEMAGEIVRELPARVSV